jgi:hypothetical protein
MNILLLAILFLFAPFCIFADQNQTQNGSIQPPPPVRFIHFPLNFFCDFPSRHNHHRLSKTEQPQADMEEEVADIRHNNIRPNMKWPMNIVNG